MNKHLQRILSLLCVLALVLGCTSAFAQDPTVQYDSQVLMIVWDDNNNYDGDRPTTPVGAAFVTASGNVQAPDLSEANGWTTEVSVSTGTTGSWTLTTKLPEGYTQNQELSNGLTTMYLRKEKLKTVDKTAQIVEWADADNVGKIRPDKVKLVLLADGEPYGEPQDALSPAWKAEWKDLPERKPGKTDKIVYTVKAQQVPAGYTAEYEGLEVKFTLLRSRLTLNVSVSGYPEGADLSGLSLKVDGPDPSMPRTLAWSQVSGGSYDFGEVLPGAYLVMGSAPEIEGYTMDTANSTISDAVYAKAGESASLSYKYTYKEPEPIEDVDPDYDPTANFSNLSFEILGPDDSMSMRITYDKFKDGKYEIPQNLIPGTYTVVERNAESLVNYYVLDIDSVTGAVIEVAPNGTAVKKLYNKYVPAPTPEPDAEFVDVPVTKTWADENNRDGNRPDSVTVRLYADGVEVGSHVLTAAENWNYTFTELPRYKEDNKTEIVYTVNEDAVPMYSGQINGYNLVNVYQPEVTSLTVAKHWNDNNNEAKRRPLSIFMTLIQSQGGASKIIKVVELNEGNGWIQTVGDLPVTVNGERATYSWTEQTVLNYFVEEVTQIGSVVTFTNKYFVPQQTIGGPQKKTGTTEYTVIGDYETALGMDVIINHVGDCFD